MVDFIPFLSFEESFESLPERLVAKHRKKMILHEVFQRKVFSFLSSPKIFIFPKLPIVLTGGLFSHLFSERFIWFIFFNNSAWILSSPLFSPTRSSSLSPILPSTDKQLRMEWQDIFSNLFNQKFSQRVFGANFGASPEVCQWLWGFVENLAGCERRHLLWALNFLKTGGTYATLSTRFRVGERNLQEWVWKVIEHLDQNLDEVSLLQNEFFGIRTPKIFFKDRSRGQGNRTPSQKF